MPRILFVGGTSVGHIAPAVAIWEELKNIGEFDAHFVCSPRPDDAPFLEANKLPYTILDAPRLSASFPFKFIRAVHNAKHILDDKQPDIIFSKGGYVSLALCFAAKKRGIPIITHESDAVSGYANRIIAKWADVVCTGFPSQHTHTGNPIRKNITNGSREQGLRSTGLSGNKPILLVTGGSQGAMAINNAVASQLHDLLLRCDVIHITGRGKATKVSANGYTQKEFVTDELPDIYAATNIALGRGGIGLLSELAACGIPTIVVPLRGVGHDHQYNNALAAERTGGCIHLDESELSTKLLSTVHTLVTDTSLREEMSKKIANFAQADAALQIARIIVKTLDSTR